jgi:hypothetical protein
MSTAMLLWPLIPKALSLPSPDQLRAANLGLQREIGIRLAAEAAVRQARDELESRVALRTEELGRANTDLHEKIAELQKFEEVVVGRELRMIEMKKELEQLRGEVAKLGGKPAADSSP